MVWYGMVRYGMVWYDMLEVFEGAPVPVNGWVFFNMHDLALLHPLWHQKMY